MDVTNDGSGGDIEGYSTTKYTIATEYDIVMKIMGMDMNGAVETTSEVWSTDEIERENITFIQQRDFRTGIEGIDELIESQMKAMKGFPLKVITQNKTTMRGRTQNSTTTMEVKNITEVTPGDDLFEVPSGYERVEMPTLDLNALQGRR